ncbi:AIPR family protein [Tatumella sp. JGM118]|uniref:AIPR family protein n=1 Tax=Tatumella sp. JGM118 TaxID=2799796 RepID=UPI001BAF9E9E|nr:AIPR family protein [Tatumella sp. JGM118]MBS0908140.1 AIPR family protein [Tatumella sp. JGM118]
MAGINTFKNLNVKCERYYNLLTKTIPIKKTLTEEKVIDKRRIGFYLFILESFGRGKDIVDLSQCIIDSDFNDIVYGVGHDDLGIDAVLFDDEKQEINLFNFKYRGKFTATSTQALNDPFISSKYFNAIETENLSGVNGKVKDSLEKIIELLNGNNIWRITFYSVSNESNNIRLNDPHLDRLRDIYDLEVKSISLDYISDMMSLRPEPICASILFDSNCIMPYVEHELSSSKSYIVRMKASELIRITSKNSSLRDDYNIEDINPLSKTELDYGVLFDNVRGFVLNSKYNVNINKTLKNSPSKLFMYNNGITMVAKEIHSEGINGNRKQKMRINDFQVLNGGQTLRTIHDFNKESEKNISDILNECEILVRIFSSSGNDNTINKIAEYTNSQNSISTADLKSLSSEQIDIENYLSNYDILYSRKSGDIGDSDKNYNYQITMEKFGQLLLAIKKGEPDKSSNHKQYIFSKYYDDLFLNDFDISESLEIINRYKISIAAYYNRPDVIFMEQKIYYLVYMISKYPSCNVDVLINTLEEEISSFREGDKSLSDARKMIQVRFREGLESSLEQKVASLG